MSKFIPISEASVFLNTTSRIIYVTVCQYKKRNGELPVWYKTDGRAASIDIEFLNRIRDNEIALHHASTELYYFINDEMKVIEASLARTLAMESEIYNKVSSWRSFLQTTLFSEPRVRFHDRVTRLQEFHRIASKLKDDFLCATKI